MDITYYTPEGMKDKKLSDLKDNDAFLTDAVTFLQSSRKGYTAEELSKYTSEDVVYEILEHFRVMNTNEVTMAKDYSFMEDKTTKDADRQAYARLMFAFDNAKGEGILDGGFAGIRDYAEGILTAPTTYASAAVAPLTAGTGTAAVQAAKIGTQQALKSFAKNQIKRGLVTATLEGSVAAGSQLGIELTKKKAGESIGEDYDVSGTNVASAGVLGGAIGGAAFALPMRQQYKAAERLVDTLGEGAAAKAARHAEAEELAKLTLKDTAKTEEGKELIEYQTKKILRAIDPKLVEEGRKTKIDILSKDLPEGLIGGLDTNTVRRLAGAAVELASSLGIEPQKGQRITEFLAGVMETGGDNNVFDQVRKRYGLTRRQLATVYAADVSDAARELAIHGHFVRNDGVKVVGKEAREEADKFKDKLDRLYDEGMSTVSGTEAKELQAAQLTMTVGNRALKALKTFEDTRRAFMTSQPATTLRNTIFGVAMTGIDAIDQINLAVLKAAGFGDGPKTAGATAAGAMDIAAYLTKDAYVADALVAMLKEDSPELVSRVFRDAAMAEATTVGNSRMARAGSAVNALNTVSDHIFKKAVVAGFIDRKLAEQGSSLMEYMKAGKISDIDDEIINAALDESQAFTFQRRFGGKGSSKASKITNEVINTIHNYGFTVLIPFPRYMASQAKFLSDYTVLGLLRKRGDTTAEEFSKQMTGAVMLGSAMLMQRDNIINGLEWFEEAVTDGHMGPDGRYQKGEATNAQAAMGPTAAIHYTANVMQRYLMGMPMKEIGEMRKEMQQILVGTEFRPGGGAVADMEAFLSTGEPARFIKMLGDYTSAFTYPAAVLKDFYGQFDPRAAYIPQTRDATMNIVDLGGMNFPALEIMQRSAKALPDFNLAEMSETLKDVTGIDLGEPELTGLLKWMGSSARTQFQLMEPLNRDTGYDTVRHNIFGYGPLRQLDPFMKQITGFTKNAPKSELEIEMTRLQINPYDIYPQYAERNSALELFTQQILQGTLVERAKEKMAEPLYFNSDMSGRKDILSRLIREEISFARNAAREVLSDYSAKTERYNSDFNAYIRGEYAAMSGNERKKADSGWTYAAEIYGYEGLTFKESLDKIQEEFKDDKDEREARQSIMLLWYMNAGKQYDKAIDDFVER